MWSTQHPPSLATGSDRRVERRRRSRQAAARPRRHPRRRKGRCGDIGTVPHARRRRPGGSRRSDRAIHPRQHQLFVQVGINTDLGALGSAGAIGLATTLSVVAIAARLCSGWAAAGTRADKWQIGIGMIPRGEMGLIFAGIGLAGFGSTIGLLSQELYGAVIVAVLVSTIVTPPLLRLRLDTSATRHTDSTPATTAEPKADGCRSPTASSNCTDSHLSAKRSRWHSRPPHGRAMLDRAQSC